MLKTINTAAMVSLPVLMLCMLLSYWFTDHINKWWGIFAVVSFVTALVTQFFLPFDEEKD